jgi:hypothetical protein
MNDDQERCEIKGCDFPLGKGKRYVYEGKKVCYRCHDELCNIELR